ncbi:uncharacterized protein J3R85_006600 [Psidium guajava]|nr:uncharacterized protein J3R85_006600 [Psidium guajava]
MPLRLNEKEGKAFVAFAVFVRIRLKNLVCVFFWEV